MIADSLANAALYERVHPGLAAAFAYLAAFDPATPDGKHPIDGDRIVATVQRYATKPEAEKRWESHRRFLDVQFIVSGHERIGYAHVNALAGATPYDEAKDIVYYADAPDRTGTLAMEPGHFAIFLPDDGHRPGVAAGASEEVRKIVVKVLL